MNIPRINAIPTNPNNNKPSFKCIYVKYVGGSVTPESIQAPLAKAHEVFRPVLDALEKLGYQVRLILDRDKRGPFLAIENSRGARQYKDGEPIGGRFGESIVPAIGEFLDFAQNNIGNIGKK